jgi:hypothetical protein
MLAFIQRLTARGAASCVLLFGLAGFLHAETNDFAARAERVFNEARAAARKNPDDHSASVQFARLCFDWAEYARNDDQREEIAQTGIAAARAVIARESTNSPAHYWLGMNLGQLARTKTLGALRLVREMEDEFHRARNYDPHTDYAGPDRSLGMLYRDAPGWPTSIGSRKKSREHFDSAIRLHPEFPDNQLGLLEAFDDWADRKSFLLQLVITEKTIAEAKTKFVGEPWASSWADWNQRLAKMKRRGESSGLSTTGKSGK